MLRKHSKQGSEVYWIMARRGCLGIVPVLRIVIGVVLANDFNHNAHANSQRVAALKHGGYQRCYARFRAKLPGESVRADARLFVLCGIGRNSDYGLQKLTG